MKNLTIVRVAGAFLALMLPAQTPVEYPQITPRTAPTDYMAHEKAGNITIAADFVAHALPTPEGMFTSEDYVVFEVAVYGPPGAKATLAFSDFSMRINDKKAPIPGQPNGVVFRSLSDPEWQPPKVEDDKKQRPAGEPPPPTPKMPFAMRRTMEQKVQKAALPEGERDLPVAGLIFFPYRGKDSGIKSAELIYSGSAGTATLKFER